MAVSISVSITQNSQSTTTNKSNVTVKVNYSWTYGSWNHLSSTKYVKINGTKYSFNDAKINPNNTTSGSGTLFTKTLDISHNSDGTGKVDVYAYVDTDISSGVLTKSASKTLTTIARASTISATSAYVENQSTISISRKSSSFTHTITWACGSASGTVATKTSSTSIKWTLPTSIYAQIGSTATSKTVTLTCTTYNGSTKIGDSKTCTLTAKTSASRNGPTLSPVVSTGGDTQALTGDSTTIIKGWTTAYVTFNAAAQDSATLKSQKVINSGQTKQIDGSAFANCTEGTFTFSATDSRGYTTTKTKTSKVINYLKPTLVLKVTIGLDGKASIRASGRFFSGSFGAKTNALNIQFRYKVSGGSYSSWTTFSSASPGTNTWSASHTLSGLNYQKTYYFEARAIDLTGNSASQDIKVRSYPVWDWGQNNFHVHGHLRIDNNQAFCGKSADGTSKVNVAYVSPSDNVVIGGGSYPPKTIYLDANGGNITASNDGGSTYYSLIGAAKALANTYEIPCTVTAGSDYKDCSATAYLTGNCLRLGFTATRKTAAGVGNITNETVMTIKLAHGGKIDNLYRVSANSDTSGAVTAYSVQAAKDSETQHTVTVILTATTNELELVSCYCVMPANIHLAAYV